MRDNELKCVSTEHGFYLAKVEIQYIMLQDFYGRPTNVPVDEYYAADPSTYTPSSELLEI